MKVVETRHQITNILVIRITTCFIMARSKFECILDMNGIRKYPCRNYGLFIFDNSILFFLN